MQTAIIIAAIVIMCALSFVVAYVLAPRKIAEDVMLQAFGDAPHIEREG